LKVLDALRSYCDRPAGEYPPPTALFTLGPPDLPIKDIVVVSHQENSSKNISWPYPYARLATETNQGTVPKYGFHSCKNDRERTDEFVGHRALIMSGLRTKQLFDCKRGIVGHFLPGEHEEKDLPRYTVVVRPQSSEGRHYREVCQQVTHEKPYSPE
jgi:hypothetical protein